MLPMGKKFKKHGNRQSADDLFHYAQRAMEKQDFKEALKNAKVCFRQDPSHQHRQLLERSWLARGLQLARAGLQTEGRAAAQELLAMGATQPDVRQGLPELLMAVGLYDQVVAGGKFSGLAPDAAVLARAADRAVADPATAPASLGGVREGAAKVREAIDALYSGDESAALAALSDVPRNSPFAEWKFFVRGLAAYYRHDDEAMHANWDRLAHDRFAARLARPLRRLADPAGSGDAVANSEEFREAIRVLEQDVCGGPVVWYLESLQSSLQAHRWRQALFGVRRWREEIRATLPNLVRRLDRLFYDLAVRKANPRWLYDLTVSFDPPRWDPRWNRAGALIAEGDDDALVATVERFWLAYLEDLASMPDLKRDERKLAQAMVWERLGRLWAGVSVDEDECEEDEYIDYGQGDEAEHGVSAREKTIECFKKAISLAPGFSDSYHALARNHLRWGQDAAAAKTFRQLLAKTPDDLNAIISLYNYHRKRDEIAAREYALQARRLKPASDDILNMVVAGRFLAARALARQDRWDEARAELSAVAEVAPKTSGFVLDVAVHRAMVEFKAGQPIVGGQWVDRALGEGGGSADVYMALAIEAHRYELPLQADSPAQLFHDRWLSSLAKHRGPAAGAMSRRIWAFMQENAQFSGKYAFLNDYLERVVEYVKHCRRIRWQAGDLTHVCRFLDLVVADRQFRALRGLLARLLDKGRKKFPQDPEFHATRGIVEMRRGPTYCDRRLARECLQAAIEAAKTSPHPNAKTIQQLAARRLRILGREYDDGPPMDDLPDGDDFADVPPEFFNARSSRAAIASLIQRIRALGGPDLRERLVDIIKQECAAMGRDSDEVIAALLGDAPVGAAAKEEE
jgi:tetratricopeptide (TPR) repeat protein